MNNKLSFQPITVGHQQLYNHYISLQNEDEIIRNCDYSFLNVCAWQHHYHTEFAEYHNWLVVRFKIKNHFAYMYPLGKGDKTEILAILESDAATNNQPLLLIGMSKLQKEEFLSYNPSDTCYVKEERDYFDYIYRKEDLAELKGKKLQAKRNHIHQFEERYQFEYKELTKDIFPEALHLCEEWMMAKGNTLELQTEYEAICFALSHFEELGGIGGAIFVHDKMVAFTYGSPICDDTFSIQIEKSDVSYVGIYAVINQQFIQHLPQHYTFINREEDLGMEGLRKAKSSYQPLYLLEKYSVWKFPQFPTNYETQLRNLWKASFHDSDSFLNLFFQHFFTPMIVRSKVIQSKVISALYLLPMIFQCNKQPLSVRYLYAVATDKNFQKKGYMNELLTKSLQRMNLEKEAFCLTIPANDSLVDFYRKFGFVESFESQTAQVGGGEERDCNDVDYLISTFQNIEKQQNGFRHTIEELTVILQDYLQAKGVVHLLQNGNEKGFRLDQTTSRGMIRITNAFLILDWYAKLHPTYSETFTINDSIIAANNGTYLLNNGQCKQINDSGEKPITITALSEYLMHELKNEFPTLCYWGMLE